MAAYAAYSVLQIEANARVAYLMIENPPVNVLDAKLITELHRFTVVVREDNEIRVIVLQSADPEIFVSHGDMNFMANPESFKQLEN